MLNKIKQWIKDNLIECEYQNLTKELKWVNQSDLIAKGFAFRRRASYVDEKCHIYADSITKFYKTANGEANGYETALVKIWGARVITFIKGTPNFLKGLLSVKKPYINVSVNYKGKIYDITGPFDSPTLETAWLRFKYSSAFRTFVEDLK